MRRKPATRLEALFDELCVRYGYCTPPADPPRNVDAFVDAVVRADGGDPTSLDKNVRGELGDVVSEWLFDEGRGKGTKSGLPLGWD